MCALGCEILPYPYNLPDIFLIDSLLPFFVLGNIQFQIKQETYVKNGKIFAS